MTILESAGDEHAGLPLLDWPETVYVRDATGAYRPFNPRIMREAREQRDIFHTVLGQVRDGITFSDEAGRFWVYNAEMERLTGYTSAEANACADFTRWLYPDPAERARALAGIVAVRETGEHAHTETTIVTKDGRRRQLSVSSCLVSFGGQPMFLTAYRDVTELKQAEERLHCYQEELRALTAEMTLAEERERRQLASELHDQIGQLLALAKMKVDEQLSLASDDEAGSAWREIGALLRTAIQSTRSLTFELCPPLLAEMGLTGTLRWLAGDLANRHGLTVEVTEDGDPKPIDEQIQGMLYWIVRELLLNVVKHAGARRVLVNIRREDTRKMITVEDDGAGFDPAQLDAPRHGMPGFGLFSIRERLRFLGGALEITAAPGHGARVRVTAPLTRG